MEIQTWLSRHYKFISAENINILSVSSEDFLHAFLAVAKEQYIYAHNGNIYVAFSISFRPFFFLQAFKIVIDA